MTAFGDPTYVKEEIEANPVWALAFKLSELDNDNAPIGWSKYIPDAERRLAAHRPDTRIAYGATCFWWGPIQSVGKHPSGLPCCPECGGMLMEVPDRAAWINGAQKAEAENRPGYFELLQWSEGKCFRTREAARDAYVAATGKAVVI